MQAAKTPAKKGAAKNALEDFVGMVAGAQPIAVGQKKRAPAHIPKFALMMHLQTAFGSQISVGPHIVVSRKKMNGQTLVGPMRQTTQQTGIATGNRLLELVPKIENIAQQNNGLSLRSHCIDPTHQLLFALQALSRTGHAQVGIRHDIHRALGVAFKEGVLQWRN